jgi:recombination protein RecT
MSTSEQTRVALQSVAPQKSLQDMIIASAKELGKALPEHLRPERLVRIALTCIRTTPKLAQCSQESFLGALFTAAQTGLEPVAGRAYILPFFNSRQKPDGSWHKVMEAQFVVGYKGLADLFYRHEKAVQLDWGVVREGDEFDYQYGSDAFLKHKPRLGNAGAPIAYWVQALLANGGKPFRVMSHEECMAHGRDHSKTWSKKDGKFYDDSPWNKEPETMCLKTVLIQLSKLLPLSVELQRAINVDESSRDYRDALRNGLDSPSATTWKDTPEVEQETPAPATISEVTGKPIELGE